MNNINKIITESYHHMLEVSDSKATVFINNLDRIVDPVTFLDTLSDDTGEDYNPYDFRSMGDEEFDNFMQVLNEVASDYVGGITNGADSIPIYRVMRVTGDWCRAFFKGDATLGKFWAYDKDVAEGYDSESLGDGMVHILISAHVSMDDVNILETYMYSLYNQAELRLTGTAVTVDDIELVDIDRTELKKQKYTTADIDDMFEVLATASKGKTYQL
jgi:hypothetical protein